MTSRVTRVVVSYPGHPEAHVTASIANGTFLARIARPAGVPDSRFATVTGYDAAGHQVTVHDDSTDRQTCYRTPGGYPVAGATNAKDCRPDTRWPS